MPSPPPPPATDPPHLSNNDPRISFQPDHHPDAPLPIESYHDEEDPLAVYEPRPIPAGEEQEEDAAAAANRPRRAWVARLRVLWLRNKGMFLVLLAQMFGASMNVMTQVLEIHSSMHPFQVGPSVSFVDGHYTCNRHRCIICLGGGSHGY